MTVHAERVSRRRSWLVTVRRSGSRIVLLAALLTTALAIPDPARALERTPVVFVPGFMGSRLVDDRGELWGTIFPMVSRLTELAYTPGKKSNSVRATEVLHDIQFLGPLKAAAYKALIAFFQQEGFEENRDLFLFPYDWRRSNLHNARALAAFIERHDALRNHRFNLIGHSMGGILAYHYLKRYGGASRVKYFITVASPHRGSADILANMLGYLTNDVRWFTWAIGEPAFMKVFLSFPSLYEQLPQDGRSCRLAGETDKPAVPCDLLDRAFWSNPAVPNLTRRALPPHLDEYLKNSREIVQSGCAGVPDGIRTFRFAGTGIDTIGRIRLTRDATAPIDPEYVIGDGLVSEDSASCADLAGTEVFFADHLSILENATFRQRLRNILRDGGGARGPVVAMSSERPASGGTWSPSGGGVPRASFTVRTRYLSQEEGVSARLRLRRADGQPVDGEIIAASIRPSSAAGAAREIAVTEPKPGEYRFSGPTGMEPGVYRLQVDIPGAGTLLEHIAVLKPSIDFPASKQIPGLPPGTDARSQAAPFRLLLSSPRGRTPVYRLGESLNLIVRTNRDAWLYCFYRRSTGGLVRVFPNKHHRDAFIAANRTQAIPGDNYPFQIDFVDPPGVERVMCFAANRDVAEDLPPEIREPANPEISETAGSHLPDIFANIPAASTSRAVLQIDLRR